MIAGRFGENGELLFEVKLIASSGEQFSVEVLLDTGYALLNINTKQQQQRKYFLT